MRWDAKKRRYVDDNGKVISSRAVRKEVADHVEHEKEITKSKARQLIASTITVGGFFSFMTSKIEDWHKLTGRIAYGGVPRMTPEREARIAEIIATQLDYLKGFKADVEQAAELTSQVENRAGMYADAAYSTYENSVKQREADAGVLSGRRICEEDAASCDECVSAASSEYMPLDELSDIGSLQCLNNCRCTIEFNYHGIEPLTVNRPTYAPWFPENVITVASTQ